MDTRRDQGITLLEAQTLGQFEHHHPAAFCDRRAILVPSLRDKYHGCRPLTGITHHPFKIEALPPCVLLPL